jgi:hypothetical protein
MKIKFGNTKRTLILILAASFPAVAQSQTQAQAGPNFLYQTSANAVSVRAFGQGPVAPVEGAPYSATITNQSVQSLADGNRILQSSTGTIARDSQGRTRQDAPLPLIGNLSAANAPHIVFIQDPVAQTTYTLNLTDKTAQKMPVFSVTTGASTIAAGPATAVFTMKMGSASNLAAPMPPPAVFFQKTIDASDPSQVTTENLGSQTMEGVLVNGTRTTRTIPAGQIGNEQPITIVTEVWTSPDLKTVVYSKVSDPRMGDQTYQLTNIVRAEPDSSLFTVPADFKVVDGPQPILFHTNQ